MNEIRVKKRDVLGKQAKRLRKEGLVPAVLYGPDVASIPIMMALSQFEKIYKKAGESTLMKLVIEGSDGEDFDVIIHDVDFDPIRQVPIHIDFYAVRMDRKIQTEVPLVFNGTSPAVKNFGGILVKVLQSLEVEALPKDLPQSIEVDLAVLKEVGSRITVGDLDLPKGVKALLDSDEVVVIVESKQELEQEEAEEQQQGSVEVKTERELAREEKQTGISEQKD